MTLPRDDLERVAGALYGALERARPYVEANATDELGRLHRQFIISAPDVLEAIDGALADAGELVGLGGRVRGGERGRAS